MIKILKSIMAATPDLVLAAMFLSTWINPGVLSGISVESMVLVIVMEFVAIHSAGFMGAILVGDASRSRKIKATLWFGAFYLLFFIAFAVMLRTWWPMLAFLVLMANRLLSILFNHNMSMTQKNMVMAEWAIALTFYILCVAVTIVIPVDSMGANMPLSTGGNGQWELHPYKALSAGVFYFALMGSSKFFMVMMANSSK